MPYRINGSDGANNRPEAARRRDQPEIEALVVAGLRQAPGYSSAPSAMIVTPDAPVKAVNNAHATSEIIARPPGSQPSSACERRTNRARRLPCAQQESGEREQRNRDEHGRFGQAEELDRDDGQIDALALETRPTRPRR